MTTSGATVSDVSPQGQAALRYAELGMHVFPCWWPHLGQCSCGNAECGSPAKHPLGTAVPNGLKDATTDQTTIRDWWTRWPQANVAIATGPSDLVVIDVDGPDGAAALTELESTYGPLPDTLTADTGRAEGAGVHLFFKQPDTPIGNRKIGQKLETRGAGGYVIAYPSIHVSGRAYTWRDHTYDTAQLPDWMQAHITRPAPAAPVAVHEIGSDSHAARRLEGAAGKVAIAPEGERNNVLNWAAYTAGRLIAAGRLDETVARDRLSVAALRAGLTPAEVDATINSGIAGGRQEPDHDDRSDNDLEPLTVTTIQQPDQVDQQPAGNSWAPVEAAQYIDGTWTPPAPTQLVRDDGNALLYAGRINLLFGESEAGKGWVALHAIQQALDRGDTVLYIDFEDYPDTIYSRLKLLGATAGQLTEQFAYIRPDHGLDDPGRQALGDTVAQLNPDLVVLDGITGAMSLHQLDTNASTDVDQFYSLLGEPLARYGAAVTFIDHVTKSAENRGKGPIGSQHKRARVSGASYEISSVQPIAPGRAGKLRIKIDKDRLGAVRTHHPAQAGEFVLDSTAGDRTVATIKAPSVTGTDGKPFRPTVLMERVSDLLEQIAPEGASTRSVRAEVSGNNKAIDTALQRLVEEGYATVETGPRGAVVHRFQGAYREADDPQSDATVPNHPVTTVPTVPDRAPTVLNAESASSERDRAHRAPGLHKAGARGTVTERTPEHTRQVPL